MLTSQIQQQQWLFRDRLNFAASESELYLRKQGYQLSQELFHAARRFDGGPIRTPITTHAHLRIIYAAFNALVLRCRFNLKNIDATCTRSRNELKKKKEIRDVEKQYRIKAKRVVDLLRQGEDQEEHWRVVLNFKNISESILKAHVFLYHLLEQNFDLLKEGAAHLRDQSLPFILQLQICLAVIDILTLINTMRLFLLPSLHEEDKTLDSKSKLELEEKKMLEDVLDNADEDKLLEIGRKLDIGRFCDTIKRIVGGMEADRQVEKIWESIFRIRLEFLVDAQGLWRRKHYATAIKQLMLYWGQVYIKHFKPLSNQNPPKPIDFTHCFKQYRSLFGYFLHQASKKEERIEQVADCLRLIQTIWINIDKSAASKIYWEQLALVSKKITLPLSFISESRNFILPIAKHIIDEFASVNNSAFLNKLRSWASQLGHRLLSLKINEQIVENYLVQQHSAARLLLTQRNALNEALEEINKVISEVKDDKLLANIKTITERMIAGVKEMEYKMEPQYQLEVIEKLYHTYQKEESLIGELEHFIQLTQFFTRNDVQVEELVECRNFYAKKREAQVQQHLLNQAGETDIKISTCLLDAIKTVTFELILNIKLDQSNKELYRLKKIIYKLLEIYRKEQQKLHPSAEQEEAEEQQFNRVKSVFLQRVQSEDMNPANFHLESPCSEENFAVNFLRKIFQLRIDMITRGLSKLDEMEQPLREEYIQIKRKMYLFVGQDPNLASYIEKLPAIEYEFIRKRYYRAWRQLRDLDIQSVNKLLEVVWDGHRGHLKLYVSLLLKFRDPLFASVIRGRDLEEKDIDRLVNECLEEKEQRAGGQKQQLRGMLKQSVRVLQNFQKLRQLKMERKEQAERLNTLEEAKHYRTKAQEIRLKIIEKQVQIHSIFKNDQLLFRKYTISPDPRQADDLLRKLRKLSQRQRNVSVQLGQDGEVTLRVDQMQTNCQSYPLLVKHLIEAYLDMFDFCTKELGCELYPLLLHSHMRIHRRQDGHASLTLDPYEGILALLLHSPRDSVLRQLYRYPCFPFIKLADELALKFKRQKIYPEATLTAESYSFNHLIEEMKALSMQSEVSDPKKTAKRILKCPYFWSSADKLLEIVQFKERYQSGINVEQCRRKQNLRVLNQLPTSQQRIFTYPSEQKHPLYKAAYGNHKTTQIYFSIEGLLEKQAFIEDIGGQGEGRGEYKYHGLVWWRQKPELSRLIEMVAERERRKGCNKSNFYQKTFGSFQNLLRNLRNLAVHYIYDNQNKKEVDLDDKLTIFQRYFPKLFVFLYRWRPLLGRDYNNDIRTQKVAFLKQVFAKPSKEAVQTLESIPQLSDYIIRNSADRNRLLNLFNYDYARKNGCEPCNILCNSLHKQPSFWSFLSDIKRQKTKQQKDMTYNVLFWQHSAKACNGNNYLGLPYYNVTQRNQFTSEEFAHVRSSLTLLQVERERLDRQIKIATEKQKKRVERALMLRREGRSEEEEDSSRGSEDETVRNEGVKQPIQKRFKKLSAGEADKLQEELLLSDYVCKYFIFQLETQFPYLFHDLRKERYQWDDRASQFPKKE